LGKSRKEIKEQIMSKQVQVKKSDIPDGWSIEAADLINKVEFSIFIISFYKENQ
jgi:hypothetical protein